MFTVCLVRKAAMRDNDLFTPRERFWMWVEVILGAMGTVVVLAAIFLIGMLTAQLLFWIFD